MSENEKTISVEFTESEFQTVLEALLIAAGDDKIGYDAHEVFNWLKRWRKTSAGEKIYGLVFEFFNNDKEKTFTWFNTRNPHLGDVSPNTFIELGRGEKILNFIKTSLDENRRT